MSTSLGLVEAAQETIPIVAVTPESYADWLGTQSDLARRWLAATNYEPKPGKTALIPGAAGELALVVHGVKADEPLWSLAGLRTSLPPGSFRVEAGPLDGAEAATRAALGWVLAGYRFEVYRKPKPAPAALVWPDAADRALVTALAEGILLARDLINTPTEAMGPGDLAVAVQGVGARFGAKVTVIEGEALLAENYPMIHAVGRASAQAPRLIDLTWGDETKPLVVLVGKGVCFDSGGLDLKPSSAMRWMKKDMGGAATLLGLAQAIMASALPIRLRLLIPAVENAVSANAFRPGDVFRTRQGKTVEIGNTDAEGRLILADALTEAAAAKPALLIDIATLTGAARTALGPDLPAAFTDDDDLARALDHAGRAWADPSWRLPLWAPYRRMIDSKVADLNNASESAFAGAITAALFLKEFVPDGTPWLHLDSFAWNPSTRPGRPEGGEALCLRALFGLLRGRFS